MLQYKIVAIIVRNQIKEVINQINRQQEFLKIPKTKSAMRAQKLPECRQKKMGILLLKIGMERGFQTHVALGMVGRIKKVIFGFPVAQKGMGELIGMCKT